MNPVTPSGERNIFMETKGVKGFIRIVERHSHVTRGVTG